MVNNTANVLWWSNPWFILTCLIPFFSFGQWDVYNISNSPIESNNVRCLELDTNGYTWIGTDNGLYAFDGNNWNVYNTSNSGISSNRIRSIYKDGDSLLWVGTFDAGVCKFNGAWVVYNSINSGIADDFVKDISRMPSGELYFATAGGLSCLQSGSWVNYDEFNSSLWSSNISSLSAWAVDTIFTGSINGGLNKVTDTIYPYNSYTSNLQDNTLLDIEIDKNFNVWGATPSGGIVKFNPQNSFFSAYLMTNSASPSNSYNGVFVDGLDSLYLSSIDAGLVTFINGAFTSVNTSNSNIPENYLTCVIKDENKLVVGTHSSGFAIADGFVNDLPENSDLYEVFINDFGIKIKCESLESFYLINLQGKVLEVKKGREVYFSSEILSPSVYFIKSENGFVKKFVVN